MKDYWQDVEWPLIQNHGRATVPDLVNHAVTLIQVAPSLGLLS